MAFPQLLNEDQAGIPVQDDWLFDGNFDSTDWLEAVSLYSPRQLGLGHRRSHATLTGYLDFDKLKSAVVYFLGFSWVDDNRFLRRQVPSAHPDMPNLFATEIVSATPVQFVTKVAAPTSFSIPYATYTLVKLTVAYTQPPYEILSDADLDMSSQANYKGQEIRRWVNWNPKSYYENLVIPGGGLVYKDSRGGPPAGFDKQVAGQGQQTLFRIQKSTRKVIWQDVPIDFITDDFGFMKKFENAIGKCSSDTDFFGQPAHTWLLDDVDIVGQEIRADPVAIAALDGYTRRMDVVMTFRYFNPTNDDPGSTEHGWRLQPHYQSGKYLPVVFNADNTRTFPDEAGMADLFTAWDV